MCNLNVALGITNNSAFPNHHHLISELYKKFKCKNTHGFCGKIIGMENKT